MRTDPRRLDTLGAYDFVPRHVRDDALENMRLLAAAVMELMVLRHHPQASGAGGSDRAA